MEYQLPSYTGDGSVPFAVLMGLRDEGTSQFQETLFCVLVYLK